MDFKQFQDILSNFREISLKNNTNELNESFSINIFEKRDFLRYYLLFDHKNTAMSLSIEISAANIKFNEFFNSQTDYKYILSILIENLTFLYHLNNHGFSLDVITEEWIWSASIEITNINSIYDLFQLIFPEVNL